MSPGWLHGDGCGGVVLDSARHATAPIRYGVAMTANRSRICATLRGGIGGGRQQGGGNVGIANGPLIRIVDIGDGAVAAGAALQHLDECPFAKAVKLRCPYTTGLIARVVGAALEAPTSSTVRYAVDSAGNLEPAAGFVNNVDTKTNFTDVATTE